MVQSLGRYHYKPYKFYIMKKRVLLITGVAALSLLSIFALASQMKPDRPGKHHPPRHGHMMEPHHGKHREMSCGGKMHAEKFDRKRGPEHGKNFKKPLEEGKPKVESPASDQK